MEKKKLKDWTYRETKELCMSMDHCYNCELRSGETSCSVADMLRGKSRPMEWEYPKPKQKQLTDSQIAICRTIGAEWVARDKSPFFDCIKLYKEKPIEKKGEYFTGDNGSLLATVDVRLFQSVDFGDCIKVPEDDSHV